MELTGTLDYLLYGTGVIFWLGAGVLMLAVLSGRVSLGIESGTYTADDEEDTQDEDKKSQ